MSDRCEIKAIFSMISVSNVWMEGVAWESQVQNLRPWTIDLKMKNVWSDWNDIRACVYKYIRTYVSTNTHTNTSAYVNTNISLSLSLCACMWSGLCHTD